VVIAKEKSDKAETKVVKVTEIPSEWMGLDIGPQSIADFKTALSSAKTVLWNGPLGVFELAPFAKGTNAIAHHLADLTGKGCITVVGGGDTVSAVSKEKLEERFSHVSTGGGASLEFLEGKVLPGVASLTDA